MSEKYVRTRSDRPLEETYENIIDLALGELLDRVWSLSSNVDAVIDKTSYVCLPELESECGEDACNDLVRSPIEIKIDRITTKVDTIIERIVTLGERLRL